MDITLTLSPSEVDTLKTLIHHHVLDLGSVDHPEEITLLEILLDKLEDATEEQ